MRAKGAVLETMCGIFGVIGRNSGRARKARSLLGHRGPDGQSLVEEPALRCAIGHNRLAIIDLSREASQPFTDQSGRFSLVFNGEIYNYRELAIELRALGSTFKTESDTEVVLEAFRSWGKGCLSRFHGMFAFAILDRGEAFGRCAVDESPLWSRPYVFLARDRLGIKPLVYSSSQHSFAFASELRALLPLSDETPSVSASALRDYAVYQSVSQPRTIFNGVSHLEPASFMVVSGAGEVLRRGQYWDIAKNASARVAEYGAMDYSEQIQIIRRALKRATDRHLVADVPVGAFLSGGLDSSAVVALMARQSAHKIKTFSLGFHADGEMRDELGDAEVSAAALRTEHHSRVVSDAEIAEVFPAAIGAWDQPSHDGINTWLVSRFAAEHVKVALSGLGGDEIFGGYAFFWDIARAFLASQRPHDCLLAAFNRMCPNRLTHAAWLRSIGETGLSQCADQQNTSSFRPGNGPGGKSISCINSNVAWLIGCRWSTECTRV